MKRILITGVAGFIGFHLAKKFLDKNFYVLGIDNLCKTYNPKLKDLRIKKLQKIINFKFIKLDINKINEQNNLTLNQHKIDSIFHLAAQAGIRESIDSPRKFFKDNIDGTLEVFEYAKKKRVKKIYYASSSSVYGKCNIYPSKETLNTNKPISIYGLTKIADELIAYYYKNTFKINSIGFRFFTVYGPYGRSDMSIPIFISSILKNKKIKLLNYGNNYRDYTYVDDVIANIFNCYEKSKNKKEFFEILNIGGERNIKLKKLIELMFIIIGKKTKIDYIKANPLDPTNSLASNTKIRNYTNYKITTKLEDGIKKTSDWIKKNLQYF
jgi:UDP-glucuronate 4-epimerase